MPCLDDNQIAALTEGLLDAEERGRVDAHLDGCPACRAVLAELAGDPRPARLVPGAKVDRYEILRPLGRGGMGSVFLARDPELGRRVALKVIAPALRDLPEAMQQFRREARAMAKLSHPNIVAIHGVGDHEGVPYVSLEYVRGRSLKERLAEGALEQPEACAIARDIAGALAEAHRHGIVHRDLKPANVLLGRDGRVRLCDFGLVERLEVAREAGWTTESTNTSVSDLVGPTFELGGTPAYMAPEQWSGETSSGATDVWALGLVLFEMLTGKLPFSSTREVELVTQICGHEPLELDHERVPAELGELVDRCLDRDPAGRPSAAELEQVLARRLEPPASAPPPPVEPAQSDRELEALRTEADRQAERARRWRALALTALLLACAVIAALLAQNV